MSPGVDVLLEVVHLAPDAVRLEAPVRVQLDGAHEAAVPALEARAQVVLHLLREPRMRQPHQSIPTGTVWMRTWKWFVEAGPAQPTVSLFSLSHRPWMLQSETAYSVPAFLVFIDTVALWCVYIVLVSTPSAPSPWAVNSTLAIW